MSCVLFVKPVDDECAVCMCMRDGQCRWVCFILNCFPQAQGCMDVCVGLGQDGGMEAAS